MYLNNIRTCIAFYWAQRVAVCFCFNHSWIHSCKRFFFAIRNCFSWWVWNEKNNQPYTHTLAFAHIEMHSVQTKCKLKRRQKSQTKRKIDLTFKLKQLSKHFATSSRRLYAHNFKKWSFFFLHRSVHNGI